MYVLMLTHVIFEKEKNYSEIWC